jgi:Fic family protein
LIGFHGSNSTDQSAVHYGSAFETCDPFEDSNGRIGRALAEGGLSANNYISITEASRATATRDLKDLVDKGAFTKTGELRHTRYRLNLPQRQERTDQRVAGRQFW